MAAISGSADDLVDEVRQLNAFVVSQAPILGDGIVQVLAGQTQHIVTQISEAVHMDAARASELGVIVQSGPWTRDQKRSIGEALACRLQETSNNSESNKTQQKTLKITTRTAKPANLGLQGYSPASLLRNTGGPVTSEAF